MMETIGIIAAMTQESNALLRYIKGWEQSGRGSFSEKHFALSGRRCVLVTSGMGVRRASEAARYLVEMSQARLLVSFCIAGAVEAELEIGDVVAVEATCRLDEGVAGPALRLESWSDTAREAIAQVLARRGRRLYTGTAITTGGSQVREDRLGGIMHPILEMETSGIAQAATEKGIPLLALRAISDGPRAPIPLDLSEVMDEDANLRAGRLLMAIVRQPRILLQLGRMMRNTQIAADHAALALVAALSQATIRHRRS